MDESDIEMELLQSDLSDFSYSGSEYIPGSEEEGSSEFSDAEMNNTVNNVNIPATSTQNNVHENTENDESQHEHLPQGDQANEPHLLESSNVWGECTETVRQFPFTGNTGLMYDFDVSDPMIVYSQFFTQDVIQLIVEETNRFAHQWLAKNQVKRRSIMRLWTDCDESELKQFLAIVMIMGINPLPKLRLYWSNNLKYENKFIKKTMARDRFEAILKCLHFHNNEIEVNPESRLGKIKDLVDLINTRCQSVMMPDENVVVDETMVPFRGRLVFRQYNPSKAHKYGIKIYKLCSENGYTHKIKIYAGKADDATGSAGHAQKVALHLMSDYLLEGRTLFADNFYTSVSLGEFLLSKKTYLCGTLRSDRVENPKDLLRNTTKMKKGASEAAENEAGVKVIAWKDSRRVLMISTRPEDNGALIDIGRQNRRREAIKKPSAVLAYNSMKKGVDLSDQLSSYYTPLRKTIRWYMKVAIELILGTCVVNAFVIYNKGKPKREQMDMLKFREALIDNLVAQATPLAPLASPPQKRKRLQHKLSQYEGSARLSRKRCIHCYKKLVEEVGTKEARNKTKKVTTFCEDCPSSPPMCLECFNETHK